MPIPKKIHFIYGLKPDFGGIPFNFAHWAAVRSAQRWNPDYEIHIWVEHKPENAYFADLETDIEIHEVKSPDSIYGNPIPHFAHRADVLRLQTLIEHGGIYLDVDTITAKPFDDLLRHDVFMAKVKNSGNLYGLCNAVMGGVANAPFLKTWLEGFRNFRSTGYDQFYDEFACEYPLRLAANNPKEIHIYDENAFFAPDMTPAGLKDLFIEDREFPEAWCHHLWEKNANKVLARFNERNFSAISCTYTSLVRRILTADCQRLAATRSEWCKEQIANRVVKLNIGCGTQFKSNHINCDLHAATGADYLFDATRDSWPFPENCVSAVDLHHVLEHFAGDVSHFFKELYRVSTDGCVIDIRVPHPRHDWFFQDPTHHRPWLPTSFLHLDREICNQWFLGGHTETPLALYWDVDFSIASQEQQSNNAKLIEYLQNKMTLTPPQIASVFNNIVCETHVVLRARKSVNG